MSMVRNLHYLLLYLMLVSVSYFLFQSRSIQATSSTYRFTNLHTAEFPSSLNQHSNHLLESGCAFSIVQQRICVHAQLTVPRDLRRRCDEVITLGSRGLVCNKNRNPTIYNTNDYILGKSLKNFCGQDLCHRDTRFSMQTRLEDAKIRYAELGTAYYKITTDAHDVLPRNEKFLIRMVFGQRTTSAEYAEYRQPWTTAEDLIRLLYSMVILARRNDTQAEPAIQRVHAALEEIQVQLEFIERMIGKIQKEQMRRDHLRVGKEDGMSMLCRAAEHVERTDAMNRWRASLPTVRMGRR